MNEIYFQLDPTVELRAFSRSSSNILGEGGERKGMERERRDGGKVAGISQNVAWPQLEPEMLHSQNGRLLHVSVSTYHSG